MSGSCRVLESVFISKSEGWYNSDVLYFHVMRRKTCCLSPLVALILEAKTTEFSRRRDAGTGRRARREVGEGGYKEMVCMDQSEVQRGESLHDHFVSFDTGFEGGEISGHSPDSASINHHILRKLRLNIFRKFPPNLTARWFGGLFDDQVAAASSGEGTP